MSLWSINEHTFDPNMKKLLSQETVFSIGNGYFCTRGAFEEGYPRDTPATLLYGVFDDIPIAREELANAPDWTVIKLFVNGERFRLDRGLILDYQRTLDIQHGILRRTVHWESPSGTHVKIASERFASLADEHIGLIRYNVTVEEGTNPDPIDIVVLGSINTAEGNNDVLHWETVDQSHTRDLIWLHSETKHSSVHLAQSMTFISSTPDFQKEVFDSDAAPTIRFSGTLSVGETFSAEKIVVMYTSHHDVEPVRAALEHHMDIIGRTSLAPEPDIHKALAVEFNSPAPSHAHTYTFDHLLAKHQKAWQQFWKDTDIILEGDDRSQLALRYNLYQLRINVSSHDSRYSIAAKGMTGFGYRGHIFHDTEIFMLPFFTYVLPNIARNLLLYRYHLLPAARKKAASNGYEGAQYPWESTLDGEEATPPAIIHPETGEVIPVLNGLIELHITASIAHAVWEYWQVTADDAFMRDYGAEIMLSTAAFWASRAEQNPQHNAYQITDVIGPDEWHEHVNNNAYTNDMARHNIQTALETLQWLKQHDPDKAAELMQELDLNELHLAHWQDVGDHLRIPQDPQTGLIEQFDGFFKLAHLDQSKFEGRHDSYQGIMGVHAVQQYQIVKQADVLMLLTVLNQAFDLNTKKVNWDYYFPITDHDYGSSLTPALHTILACELDRLDDAYRMFLKGALVDLENLRGNTPDGIHAACAGAVWQATIFGFAGLRLTEDGYTTQPRWPDGWTRLAFTFKHKGQAIHVDLRK